MDSICANETIAKDSDWYIESFAIETQEGFFLLLKKAKLTQINAKFSVNDLYQWLYIVFFRWDKNPPQATLCLVADCSRMKQYGRYRFGS